MKSKEFIEINNLIHKKLDGRLVYIKSINAYAIMIPQGYDGRETVFKDRIFYTIPEVLEAINTYGK